MLRAVLVQRIVGAGFLRVQVGARGVGQPVALVTLAAGCLLDLGRGAVLPACMARDAAAGAWRRGGSWREWRDDGIMRAAVGRPARTICAGAVLARTCVFLVVFGLVVGLGGRRMAAAAVALGVCGRVGHRVSGFHDRRAAKLALRLDGHPWLLTTNFERIVSGRAEHDIAEPSGEDKSPSYRRFAWVNLGLGVAWPKTLAWSGHLAVIGDTRLEFGSSPGDAEADKTEERPPFISSAAVETRPVFEFYCA